VNIFLLAASALALLYAILKPLGDGLFDTSAWVAKMLTPPDAQEEQASRPQPRMPQEHHLRNHGCAQWTACPIRFHGRGRCARSLAFCRHLLEATGRRSCLGLLDLNNLLSLMQSQPKPRRAGRPRLGDWRLQEGLFPAAYDGETVRFACVLMCAGMG
jgi:hypothetical protein